MGAIANHRISRVVFLLFALSVLTSCGATSTPKEGSSSLGRGSFDLSSRTPGTGEGIAQCNTFDSRKTRLAGRVTVYRDFSGVLQEDKVRIRLTNLTDKFETASSTVHIKMFRWAAETGQPLDFDDQPVAFTIESPMVPGLALSDQMTSFNYNDLVKIRDEKAVMGKTVSEFFTNTVIVPLGVDYKWDALKIVIYDGTTTLGDVDFLMPVFEANPNKYAEDHPPVVQQLHPLWSDRALTMSEAQWQARTQAFCF